MVNVIVLTWPRLEKHNGDSYSWLPQFQVTITMSTCGSEVYFSTMTIRE